MAPGGRIEVLAGARADPTSAKARIVRAEAAIQPDDRRKGFDIVTTLVSSVDFGTRLERAMHLQQVRKARIASGTTMRPLGFLLAIVTGSTVALSVGLLLTWVVIMFLPDNEAQFAPEHGPLLRAVAVFSLFAAAAAISFYGE